MYFKKGEKMGLSVLMQATWTLAFPYLIAGLEHSSSMYVLFSAFSTDVFKSNTK